MSFDLISFQGERHTEKMMKFEELFDFAIHNKSIYYDHITGLPNRNCLYKLFRKLQLNNKKYGITNFALMLIEFENLKYINGIYTGHRFIDEFSKLSAEILKGCINDKGIMFKFDGESFIIIVPYDEVQEEKASALAESIIKKFKNYVKVNFYEVSSTVYIGIALYPKHSVELDKLLELADIALYEARSCGKNTYKYYDKVFYKNFQRKSRIISNLKKAIDNNELYLEYQPQLDIRSGQIVGVEALTRWKNYELGSVPPSEFIAVAEETGFIIELGRWLIKNSFNRCSQWCKKGYPLITSINISAAQLQDSCLLNFIEDMLKEYDVLPSMIKFEITETQIVELTVKNADIIEKIKRLGIGIVLDDFGVAYSSLNYITLFPIEEIKIDKSFIDMIGKNDKVLIIIDTVKYLAGKLGVKVTAEGVETEEQFRMLKGLSCDKIQGYYISRPLPAKGIEDLIKHKSVI